MEIKLINGDYVPDYLGGILRCTDTDALLQRVLFRLTARRGQFPMLPELGSRLYLLGKESPSQRLSAAKQYVTEALSQEDVSVTDVEIFSAPDDHMELHVLLHYRGADLIVALTI